MVLKGFSCKEWRQALEDDAEEEILQPLSNLKINEDELGETEEEEIRESLNNLKMNQEECWWDVFTEEILPRLPANQLVTLGIVCKNWYRITWSPIFASLHLSVYNQSRIRILILQEYYPTMIEYTYKINGDKESKLNTRHPTDIKEFIILGTCDGLLCLLLNRSVAVYNPSTGEYFIFDTPYEFLEKERCWFGRHPSSGEYLLVMLNSTRKLGVYKFTTSNLELIHLTSSSIYPQLYLHSINCRGTLLHGAVHWPSGLYAYEVIYAYHLDDNKYFEISLPVQVNGCRHFKIGVVERCLFAIFRPTVDAVFEMWIMKEYGVQQSWTKYANILGFKYRYLSPLGFFPNGDLILNVDKKMLIKYNFKDNNNVLLTSHVANVDEIICTDSLVSPTIVFGGIVK